MKKILVLCTAWKYNYWEVPREAPYPKTSFRQLENWTELSDNCPLAGLGIYIKQKDNDFRERPFVYLIITGMRYDIYNEQPFFTIEPIKISTVKSINLIDRLTFEYKKKLNLFFSLHSAQLLRILDYIGESPPKEWLDLIEPVKSAISWQDFVGKYFLDLRDYNINNDEFEDRIAKLLSAIGFSVIQKGHKIFGEYPDGVATFEDEYAIVYDCKNRKDFIPTAEDKRALSKYLSDEKEARKEKYFHSAFIAKSFGEKQKDNFFYFP